MNPNRLPKRKGHPAWNKGKPAWNRGLTKETSESVRQGAERLSNRLRNGEVRNWHKHTEETKKKLSQIRLNSKVNYSMNVLPYLRKDGTYVNLDSGYERRLAKILDDEDIYNIMFNFLNRDDIQEAIREEIEDYANRKNKI